MTGVPDRGLAVVARVHELKLYPLTETHERMHPSAGAHDRGLAHVIGDMNGAGVRFIIILTVPWQEHTKGV